MSILARLLRDGIKIHSSRPPLPATPTKLAMGEQELQQMIPKHYMRGIEREKKDAEEGKAKDEIDIKILKFRERKLKGAPEDGKRPATAQASIHNIKVSDRIHAGLANLFASARLKDPRLLSTDLHVCRVHLTPARTKAVVQWSLLNGPDSARVASIGKALEDNKRTIAHLVGQAVPMKFQPAYLFEFRESIFDDN